MLFNDELYMLKLIKFCFCFCFCYQKIKLKKSINNDTSQFSHIISVPDNQQITVIDYDHHLYRYWVYL